MRLASFRRRSYSPGPGGLCRPVAGLACHAPCPVQMAEPPRPVQAELCRPVVGLAYHAPCPAQRVKAKHLLELLSPGGTRPGLPRGPGVTGIFPPGATIGLSPETAGEPPPDRAAARVGGGMFFGFSVLIFCSVRLVSNTGPATLNLWLCNLRFYSWRRKVRRRLG